MQRLTERDEHGIDAAPTADVATVVHGEWSFVANGAEAPECSVCGYRRNRKGNEPMTTEQIVTRLKQYAKQCDGVHSCWNAPTLLAAAALIESQAAEIARLNADCKYMCSEMLRANEATAIARMDAEDVQRRERARVDAAGQITTSPFKQGDVVWTTDMYKDNSPSECRVTSVRSVFVISGANGEPWCGTYEEEDVGESIFPTYAEAEAALKGEPK